MQDSGTYPQACELRCAQDQIRISAFNSRGNVDQAMKRISVALDESIPPQRSFLDKPDFIAYMERQIYHCCR